MTLVNINDQLYVQIKKLLKDKRISVDYPTLKNFVDRSVQEKIRIESIMKAERKK